LFKVIENWLEQRQIRQMGFTAEQWELAIADWPVMARYQGLEREELRQLTLRFLIHKSFSAGADFDVTSAMWLKIATMACVPVLNLGLDWYSHWQTLILYEGDFVPNRPYRSADGVVHGQSPGLSGEAWLRGPVILSWDAVLKAGEHARHGKASNVVIHEMAHKLDMLRDGANGAPPMHPDMRRGEWHDVFTAAWDHLRNDHQHHRQLPIDEYGLTSPAEFFAVCSETFFEAPHLMQDKMPDVYRLLCQFYRQQPGG
jgi:MtfA peptidase